MHALQRVLMQMLQQMALQRILRVHNRLRAVMIFASTPLSNEATEGVCQNDWRLWECADKVLYVCRMASKCAGKFGVALHVTAALASKADGICVVTPVSKVGHEVLLWS